MAAPEEVLTLVERFDRNIDAYKQGRYNETQVRREFIDPLFKSLGWDVENVQGYAEAYKEVVHEDAIKIGRATKAPDYSFRIGGVRKFFVEAKKPSVYIKEDIHPAYQLRRYAWSAKLPLSILTDFEEFAVYDCRVKPEKSDQASKARILYLTYPDYPQRWDELANIFSREAILKGSFDHYAESHKDKRGTAEVDVAFLQEIERWRDLLARNMALRNPRLTRRELNFAVQRTIDRIIFLRICEDRGIEDYGKLMALQNGTQVYERLLKLCYQADDRYNSGIFHFKTERDHPEAPDRLTPELQIDDKVLKDILKNLYYPDSPYEFSVLPADILGQVYEQFLGKVIRLTEGHQAKVEEKPEVKKAGGVYYTPTYIVEYIVKHTVGKLLEGKTARQVETLRVLDPACGSGSFLLGAYQYLLDWHHDAYLTDDPHKWAKGRQPRLYQNDRGEWKLTIEERKRILLNSIYGVDIDSQAVEVTKLSLLLKVLEGEDEQTLSSQMSLFQKRVLPDLSGNIKCGNSLIGSDFYEGKQLTLLDEEEMYRVNAFDWDKEFPEIVQQGGFDAVIGNPPYGYMIPSNQQAYFSKYYRHQDYQKDYYLLFLERYEYFLKEKGLLGVIVSNTWLQSLTFRRIREYLTTNYNWLRILHLPEKVFHAVVDTHVLIFQKVKDEHLKNEGFHVDIRKGNVIIQSHILSWQNIPKNGDPINIVTSVEGQRLFCKITEQSVPLMKICTVYNGVKPFEKGKGNPPQTDQIMKEKPYVREGTQPDSTWKPLLRGSLIHRYNNLWNNDYWILYGQWLAAPRDPSIFEAPEKIMARQTGDSIIATLVEKGFIARNNLHIILPLNVDYNLKYVLGIMNSRLIDFAYTFMNPEKGEALAEVKKKHVEQLPIRTINFSNPSDRSRHDKMVELVERMLDLHKQLQAAKTPQAQTLLKRQIEATDRQIDRLVYDLYDLTEEEIAIVEEQQA
jgi:type I restriction-modification system DNA methylase subunit